MNASTIVNSMPSPLQIAILGCGAVTELCHLPAAQRVPNVHIVALVDKNLERANALGKRFGVAQCVEEIEQLPSDLDGVIVALPNFLHAPVSMRFLERGIAVLVEKPMALTVKEAEALVCIAEMNHVPLQVGLMSRFIRGAQLIKRAIVEGWLGSLKHFSLENGLIYDWPAASGGIVLKEQAGGGQLVDIGSHMLDLLLWWLGDVVDVEYRDDSMGGVESDCLASLVLNSATGPVQGTVLLSRLRKLENRMCIVGERLTIDWDLSTMESVRMWSTPCGPNKQVFESSSQFPTPQTWNDAFVDQLAMFVQCIRTGQQPLTSGQSALETVALIERCYRMRKPFDFPWMNTETSVLAGASKS